MYSIKQHMEENGITNAPLNIILDGQIHRFATNNSGKDGWYVGQTFQNYTRVYYGDWSKDINRSYSSHSNECLPPHVKIKWEELAKKRKKIKILLEQDKIKELTVLWEKAAHINENHSYLIKKKLNPCNNLKQTEDKLMVPVYDFNNNLRSIQFIFLDGHKLFQKGISVKNCYWFIGKPKNVIYLSESFGNAATIHQCTGEYSACSFSAQALPSVAVYLRRKFPELPIVIVADNDGENGVGQKYAEKAAKVSNCYVRVPSLANYDKCDISDVYVKAGEPEVLNQIKVTELKKDGMVDNIKINNVTLDSICVSDSPANTQFNKYSFVSTGIISDIIEYYNTTAIQKRDGFALQTALAFCSIILGRKVKTSFGHYPSLYFLNIGKSGSGKEHQITVIQDLLGYTGKEYLLGASGYTSPGAITTALMHSPAHISLIDEFGDYLISLKDKNSNQRLVNKCLLQLFGRCGGAYIGDQYSRFSRNKGEEDKVIIQNPAITLLCAVQPAKFYKNVNYDLVNDGFLGRFLVSESIEPNKAVLMIDQPNQDTSYVLDKIKQWVDSIYKRIYGDKESYLKPQYQTSARFQTINVENQAKEIYNKYSIHINSNVIPVLETYHATELVQRWPYIVGSLSLIIALSRDPYAQTIQLSDMQNAISIVERLGNYFLETILDKINSSQYEQDKNEFLQAFLEAGNNGLTLRDMARQKPFYRFPKKERYAIIEDLLDSDLILTKEVKTSVKNTTYYFHSKFQKSQ